MSQPAEEKKGAAAQMTLLDLITQIDYVQAKRFNKLSGEAREIAEEGIIRHLRACQKTDVNPDTSAVREIIDDAQDGKRVYASVSNDKVFTA